MFDNLKSTNDSRPRGKIWYTEYYIRLSAVINYIYFN